MHEYVIIQNIIPHYRKSVFEHLSDSDIMPFFIISGDQEIGKVSPIEGKDMTNISFILARVREIRIGGAIFYWQPEAWRLVRVQRPRGIVVQGLVYDLTSWIILLWSRLLGRPAAIWTIGLQRAETGPRLWLRKLFYRLGSGLLLYGDYPKALLTAAGFPPHRMHVIYNSLDVAGQRQAESHVSEEDLTPLKERLGIGEAAHVLIFIGRLVPRKRLSIAIEAVGRLCAEGGDFHLLLIGDGEDAETLRAAALEHGVGDRVHFIGALYDENEIARFMRLSHAAVIPEAGLPIIHPMGYGVPPIISDNIERHGTEWEAVAEGKTGFFYRDEDVASLTAAIQRCFADDALRQEISKNCREIVLERYTADGHARRIIEGVKMFEKR